MTNFKKIIPILFLLLLLPSISFGQVSSEGGLVPCTGEDICEFGDFYILIKNIIDFLLLYAVIPIATISIAVAGFYLLTSGDNSGNRTKAKNIIIWVAIGIAISFGAWLIVNTILGALVNSDFKTPLLE